MTDPYGRDIDYMRLSVTDKCNLNCFYCKTGPVKTLSHAEILRIEDFVSVAEAFRELGGKKFRITGGEPLIRKGVCVLIEKLVSLDATVGMTTNGVLLKRFAPELKSAGLNSLNVSLDTTDDQVYRSIGGGDVSEVIDGIILASDLGFKLKINAVLMKGINDDVFPLAEFARTVGAELRFIELMPFSPTEKLISDKFVSAAEVAERHGLSRTERAGNVTFYEGQGYRAGFITPLSDKFCVSCNRLRLTCTGKLLPCLHSDVSFDIRPYLSDKAGLKDLLKAACTAKPACHRLEEGVRQTADMGSIGG